MVITLAVVLGVASVVPRRLGSTGSPSASPNVAPASPRAAPTVDRRRIQLVLDLNARAGKARAALLDALAAKSFPLSEVITEIRQLAGTAENGREAARLLAAEPGGRAVGTAARAYFDRIQQAARDASLASVRNAAAYRESAAAIARILEDGPELDAQLIELLAVAGSPGPGATPAGASPPAPSASPSPEPSVSPAPPPSTVPSQVPANELLVNGGFDVAINPWQLVVRDPAADASVRLDREVLRTGLGAARIDIASESGSRSGIVLRQGGLGIQSGRRYRWSIWLQAASARDVRLAVVSPDGAAYATGVFSVRSIWTRCDLEFAVVASDAAAAAEIGLGQSNASVWVDDASIAPIGG
jgi:hypothetical protein